MASIQKSLPELAVFKSYMAKLAVVYAPEFQEPENCVQTPVVALAVMVPIDDPLIENFSLAGLSEWLEATQNEMV
jgi:hypothetical protein